jgi:integrase
MGKLYNRGGTWYADYFDRAGRRRRCSTRTSDSKVARVRLRELEMATTDRPAHETEALDAALTYFVDVACAGKPDGTISCYRQKSRHVSRLLGATPIGALKLESIERYIATRLGEGSHRHSVHKELVVLRGALASAKERERGGDPSVVPKFHAGYTPRAEYLTPDQFVRMIDHLLPPAPIRAKAKTLADREERLARRTLYCLLIALASPRRGELEALAWTDVDLGRGALRVPKGKTKPRAIAIHPVLRPWLESFGERAGWDGRVLEPWANVGRDMPAACKRAGVPRCTPNDLRRTFASWLVQAGESLLVVSRLLGHSSTRMVDLVYGQLDESTLSRAILRLPGVEALPCDAGVSRAVPNAGAGGAGGTSASPPSIRNSVEESFASTEKEVPRDGVEPPTRGFSGLASRAPKPSPRKRLLRAV